MKKELKITKEEYIQLCKERCTDEEVLNLMWSVHYSNPQLSFSEFALIIPYCHLPIEVVESKVFWFL